MATPGVRRAVWAAIVMTGTAGAAPAFYFDGWPGSGQTPVVTLVGPQAKSITVGVEGEKTIPPVTTTGLPPEEPHKTHDTPEPATATIAACGLLGLVSWKWRSLRRQA